MGFNLGFKGLKCASVMLFIFNILLLK